MYIYDLTLYMFWDFHFYDTLFFQEYLLSPEDQIQP